jgi:ParB/RepB/Spo0J family partition protein
MEDKFEATVQEIPCAEIRRGDNDRTQFDWSALNELADSIKLNGLAQPITVRPLPEETPDGKKYEIVAGERRFRAVDDRLKLPTIPCIVRELTDEQASSIMLIENMARKDLDPIDEAKAYKKRMEQFGWDNWTLGRKIGVNGARIRSRLSLLNLHDWVLGNVREGRIPLGHAEAMSVLDYKRQIILATPIVESKKVPALGNFQKAVDTLRIEMLNEPTDEDGNVVPPPPDGNQESASSTVAIYKAATFPVAMDLPKVRMTDIHTAGAIMYNYIGDLLKEKKYREAETIGVMLAFLIDNNFVRIPPEFRILVDGKDESGEQVSQPEYIKAINRFASLDI